MAVVMMTVIVTMIVAARRMIVIVPVMLVEYLLRERVVFAERLVVAVLVSAAVRARFGLERLRFMRDEHA